ncbi:MAG: FAD-binding protein [Thermoleophilia bacterium]|nr:FAD-binding protein [Thermoleophilia bacterium]
MSIEREIKTDVLVIGGGIAGCFAAKKAREAGLEVTIVDKGRAGKSGASIAAGGCFMVFDPDQGHDFDASMEAISAKGEYVNNRSWDEVILRESWPAFQELIAWGVDFPVDLEHMSSYETERYSQKYVADFAEPPFGKYPLQFRKVSPVLRREAERSGVRIFDRIMITDLLQEEGRVTGAIGFSFDPWEMYVFRAKAVVLSGGGSNFRSPGYHMWMQTGDAEGMAYRAGAAVTGKEFPDTHFNLAMYPAWKSNAELYPAFFYFTDSEGRYIEHSGMDLSMVFAIHEGRGPILYDLDAATPEDVASMREYLRKRANPIEVERTGLDVGAGGKYQVIGGSAAGNSECQTSGIWTIDTTCATDLAGLYVAGDCAGTRACGSIHTSGGWGLATAAVTGKRAGMSAAQYAAVQGGRSRSASADLEPLRQVVVAPLERTGGFHPRWVTQLLQNTMMPYYVLHVKHGDRLQAALTMVEFLRDHMVPRLMAKDAHELRLAHETKNMVLSAEMMLRASLARTESRGQHYREDCPRRDDPGWLAWTRVSRGADGGMTVSREPLPQEWWPDLTRPYEERYPVRFPGEQAQETAEV